MIEIKVRARQYLEIKIENKDGYFAIIEFEKSDIWQARYIKDAVMIKKDGVELKLPRTGFDKRFEVV